MRRRQGADRLQEPARRPRETGHRSVGSQRAAADHGGRHARQYSCDVHAQPAATLIRAAHHGDQKKPAQVSFRLPLNGVYHGFVNCQFSIAMQLLNKTSPRPRWHPLRPPASPPVQTRDPVGPPTRTLGAASLIYKLKAGCVIEPSRQPAYCGLRAAPARPSAKLCWLRRGGSAGSFTGGYSRTRAALSAGVDARQGAPVAHPHGDVGACSKSMRSCSR